MKRTIAVKELAQFLYSSGDLTREFFSNKTNLDGKKAHSFLQNQYNDESKKEYYIKSEFKYKENEFLIHGFIDGVIDENGTTVLEEIKSTQTKLKTIDLDFHKEYLAQLLLYAYLYTNINLLDTINIRLTYIHTPDYETKSIDMVKTRDELETFFLDTIERYTSWLSLLDDTNNQTLSTLKNIKFPFETKREGQHDLMRATYYTLNNKSILYAIAPTGIGKTMATLFSGLKTINKRDEKLFYLTAKSMGKSVVRDSINLLLDKGLKLKAIILTSKAKACLTGEKICKPDKCKYAKGYFDRLRSAVEDIYVHESLLSEEKIKEYAIKYNICPFEFSLDLSEFCDLIVCDYNYVFDPKAHLIRYFEDNKYKVKILCDEAHNLVDRSREMYSSSLIHTDIINLIECLMQFDKTLFRKKNVLLNMLKEFEDIMSENLYYYSHYLDEGLVNLLRQIENISFNIFADHEEFEGRDDALIYYFNLKDLLDTIEYYSENHLFMIKKVDNVFHIEVRCMDASSFLTDTINTSSLGVVFFSATMYPINYYMDLLTKGNGKYLTLESPFDSSRLKLIVNDTISTKYKDRENTIDEIASTIRTLVKSKNGNYIAFFPSYKYIELVFDKLKDLDTTIIIQNRLMNEKDRENVLEMFKNTREPHLGLFVLGGSFSEGVDLKGDLLNGVIVVGVALPMVNIENNLLQEFFENKYGKGFDYAYTYPGFTKVIQAAGRVIRTFSDYGVVILVDRRYKYHTYTSLMPNNWNHRKIINDKEELLETLEAFWLEYEK